MLGKFREIIKAYNLDECRIDQVDRLVNKMYEEVEEELRKKINEKIRLHEFSEVQQITKDLAELVLHKNEMDKMKGYCEIVPLELSDNEDGITTVAFVDYYNEDKVILKAGSQIRKNISGSSGQERDKKDGDLIDIGEQYKLKKDKRFDSVNSAGAFVLGVISMNGYTTWKVADTDVYLEEYLDEGMTLGDIRENKEEVLEFYVEKDPIEIELVHRRNKAFIRATAEYYPKYTMLKAGSQIQKSNTRTIRPGIQDDREESKIKGELVDKGEYYELAEDKKFTSPIHAGQFIVGGSIRGYDHWTIKETGEKLPKKKEHRFVISPKE